MENTIVLTKINNLDENTLMLIYEKLKEFSSIFNRVCKRWSEIGTKTRRISPLIVINDSLLLWSMENGKWVDYQTRFEFEMRELKKRDDKRKQELYIKDCEMYEEVFEDSRDEDE